MSQTDRLYELLKDGKPHRSDEIIRVVYGAAHLGAANFKGRIYDIKKKYGVSIPTATPDPDRPTLSWYQMKIDKPAEPAALFDVPETPIRREYA